MEVLQRYDTHVYKSANPEHYPTEPEVSYQRMGDCKTQWDNICDACIGRATSVAQEVNAYVEGQRAQKIAPEYDSRGVGQQIPILVTECT